MRAVRPKKFLGQHFLTDLSIASRIADTVDACPELPILEVGPGMGVMTQFLVQKSRQVKVVEIDYESVEYLRRTYPELEDSIIEDDFLKMHLERTFEGSPFVLTGNYPYNISSQIFFKMLDYKALIPCCTGMIQKEVAERIAAKPGSKTYGILSVLIQAWYGARRLQPASKSSKRSHTPYEKRDNQARLRREALQKACQNNVQPEAQDSPQQHQATPVATRNRKRGETGLHGTAGRPNHDAATGTTLGAKLYRPYPAT